MAALTYDETHEPPLRNALFLWAATFAPQVRMVKWSSG